LLFFVFWGRRGEGEGEGEGNGYGNEAIEI
jgi:hypothetical protein